MSTLRIKVDYDVEEKLDDKKKKRRYSSEDSETSSSSLNSCSKESDSGSSSSYSSEMTKRKKKKEKHLKKKTMQKSLKKKQKKCKKKKKLKNVCTGLESSKKTSNEDLSEETFGPPIPKAIENVTSKKMAPLTKEQWELQQNITRRVLDEETGRMRLIKGDGEVMEEIVSRDRHKNINKQATIRDGNFFQNKIGKII